MCILKSATPHFHSLMAIFAYTALKRDGSIATGDVNANDRAEALRKLERNSLQPVSVKPKEANTTLKKQIPIRKNNLFNVILFICGFSTAFLFNQSSTTEDKFKASDLANEDQIRRTSRTSTTVQNTRLSPKLVQEDIERINQAAATGVKEALTLALNEIPSSRIPALFEEMKRQASFTGLSNEQKAQMIELIDLWYEKKPNSVISWLGTLEHEEDAAKLIKNIVSLESTRDWELAVTLVGQFGCRPPESLTERFKEGDASVMMKMMKAFAKDQYTTGVEVEFPKEFDFASMAKMFDQDSVSASETDRLSYSIFPENFLGEWAKQDPLAAWEWASKYPKIEGIGEFGQVYGQLKQEYGYAEANKLLVQNLANQPDSKIKYDQASDFLRDDDDKDALNDFISQLPGKREDHLMGLIEQSLAHDFGDYRGYRAAIINAMTDEERKALIPAYIRDVNDIYADPSFDYLRRDVIDILRKIGYSYAQAKDLVPSVK